MSYIRWEDAERDSIVTHALSYAKTHTTTKLGALTFGMKAALPEARWRNCASLKHFGEYVVSEFDRRLLLPEDPVKTHPRIGRSQGGEVKESPVQAEQPTPKETAPDLHEEFILKFPDIAIPQEFIEAIVTRVEQRVMQKLALASRESLPSPTPVTSEEDAKPASTGPALKVVVIGLLPQRHTWLRTGIPSRLRDRLNFEFYMNPDHVGLLKDEHIVVHVSRLTRPVGISSPGRYYHVHQDSSALNTIISAADYHLARMDKNQ